VSNPKPFGSAVSVPKHRAWRTARLGGVATGVAANMAARGMQDVLSGKRPNVRDLLMTPRNIARITDELARMRGAAMKLGQLVSMDAGDVLPPELSQIMSRLRAEADFMPPAQLKKVLTSGWGNGWLKQFKQFNVHPIAAASIGQVHRAMLKDGRDVAVKVQYPGVAQSIDSDVANVVALIKLSGLLPKGFELDPYIEEARQQLHEETDYLAEARHLTMFRELLADDERYELPIVYADLTVRPILAMSYIESVPLEALAEAEPALRNKIAADLIDLALRELFEFGVVQSDPNYANFRFNPETKRIVLLDFGATRHVQPEVVASYRDLILAGLAGNGEEIRKHALALGLFAEDIEPTHLERLRCMMDYVFAAVGSKADYDFSDQTLSRKMTDEGMALAESGFVPPPVPMDVLFIQRKLAGVFLIATNLKAKVPLRRLIERRLVG